LIAYGRKRWEFRSYEVKKRGTIGIAASPNPPYSTKNESLNKAAADFPRGLLLGTAELVNCFYATSTDLKKAMTEPVEILLHGHKILTLDSPIGEPKEDVESAAGLPAWESYAWEIENVQPVWAQITISPESRSTWAYVDYQG